MFVCFVAALASGFSSTPKLNSSSAPRCTDNRCGFLGVGYNIIGGDPNANLVDPGWAQKIFDRDWIIANGEVLETNGCSYESTVSSISGGRSIQTSRSKTTTISTSAGGTIGGWGLNVAFTASDDTLEMNESAWTESTYFEEAHATCVIYVVKLPDALGVPFKFTPGFEAKVRLLPTAKGASSDEKLEAWMAEFGTHYTSAVTMGGMYARRYTLSESSWKTYQEAAKNKGFSAEAGVDGLFSASTGASIETNEDATDAFETALSDGNVKVLYKGGVEFKEGNLGAWADGLRHGGLAPVFAGPQNVLEPITALLTPRNFPELDPGVQATAEEFAQRLCTHGGPNLGHPRCTPFAIDPIRPFSMPTGYGITSVAWARDDSNVATGDAGGFVQTWDVRNVESLLKKFGPTDPVYSVAYSPNGMDLAVGFGRQRLGGQSEAADNNHQSVRIMDTVTGDIKRTLDNAGGSVAYSSDGKNLAAVNKDGTRSNTVVQIYKATEDTPFITQHAWTGSESNFVNSLAYSPDGTRLAQTFFLDISACLGTLLDSPHTFCVGIQIWNTATGEITRTLGEPLCLQGDVRSCASPPVHSVAYSPSGDYLASGSYFGEVSIWSTTTGTLTRRLMHGPSCVEDRLACAVRVNSVAYSPDGTHIASGGSDGSVKTWNTATGELTNTFAGKGEVNSVAYSRDGRSLASGRTVSAEQFNTAGSLTIDTV